MMLRYLIHEYKYPDNVVSGISGNSYITGTTTGWTSRMTGKFIYIMDYGYVTVTFNSSTRLDISSPLTADITAKKWFEDISEAVIAPSDINKKIESDNPGEAGVIVFDDTALEFYMDYDEVANEHVESVKHYFDTNLTADNRYYILIRLIKDLTNEEYTYYHGIINFAGLEFSTLKEDGSPILRRTVKFDGLDKITALNMLMSNDRQRGNWINLSSNVSGWTQYGTSVGDSYFVAWKLPPFNTGLDREMHPFKRIYDDTAVSSELLVLISLKHESGGTRSVISQQTSYDSMPNVNNIQIFTTGGYYYYAFTFDSNPNLSVGTTFHLNYPGSGPTLVHWNWSVDVIASSVTVWCKAISGSIGNYPGTWTCYKHRDSDAVVKKGECIVINVTDTDTNADNYVSYFVVDSGIINVASGGSEGTATWTYIMPLPITDTNDGNYNSSQGNFYYCPSTYYSKPENFIDRILSIQTILGSGRTGVINFDALKILEAILDSTYGDTILVNKLYDSGGNIISPFLIPINYFPRLIDNLPFGKDSLEAVELIANMMRAYVWTDIDGNFVVQNKESFDHFPISPRTIDDNLIEVVSEKYFWDKLVDAVEIYVQSFVLSLTPDLIWDGNYLDGLGIAYNFVGIQPRNKLEKDVIIGYDELDTLGYTVTANGSLVEKTPSTPPMTEEEILNDVGDEIAADYMAFYGNRHAAFDISLGRFTWAMREWSVCDIFTFNSMDCFVTGLNVSPVKNSMSFQLVEKAFHIFANGSVIVGKKVDDYVAGGQSSGGGGNLYITGGGVAVNNLYWSGSPLYLDAVLGRSSLQLDTWLEDKDLFTLSGLTDGYVPYYDGTTLLTLVDSPIFFDVGTGNTTFTTGGIIVTLGDIVLTDGTIRIADLTDGYVPYHSSDAVGLIDSGIYTDATGNIGIGTTDLSSPITIHKSAGGGSIVMRYGTDNSDSSGLVVFKSRGSVASPTAVLSGDNLFTFGAGGWDGSSWISNSAAIFIRASANWSGSARDTKLILATTSGTVRSDVVTVMDNTRVGFMTSAPDKALEINSADGNNLRLTYNDSDGSAINYTDFLTDINGNLFIQASSNLVRVGVTIYTTLQNGDMFSDNFADGDPIIGYYVGRTGSMFDKITATAMHVKSFIADLEQALAGSQIISKSVAKLYSDFIYGTSPYLIVDAFEGYTSMAVFVNDDTVRLREFSRAGGGLTVGDMWLKVTLAIGYDTDGYTDGINTILGTQAYTYILVTGSGTITTVDKGTLVLDYGEIGDGIIETVAIGALGGKPFARIMEWTSGDIPVMSTMERHGHLQGVITTELLGGATDLGDVYGFYSANAYLEGNVYIAGNIWALTGGFGGSVSTPVIAVDSYGLALNYTSGTRHTGIAGYNGNDVETFLLSPDGSLRVGLSAGNNLSYVASTGVMTLRGVLRQSQDGTITYDDLRNRGIWATATDYKVGDLVTYGSPSSSWRCILAHTSNGTVNDPTPAHSTWWSIFAEAGQDGTSGGTSRGVSLTFDNQAFTYDETGKNPSPASATLTATATNTSGTVYYKFILNGGTLRDWEATATATYTPQVNFSSMPDTLEVQISEDSGGSPILAKDSSSAFGLMAGSNAITIILSNDSHTIPADSDGSNGNFTGSGTTIKVWEGATPVPIDPTSTYDSPSFRVSEVGNGITIGTPIEVYGEYTYTLADATAMSGDTANVTFTIIVKNSLGVEATFTKLQTLSKAKAGVDGVGVDADYLIVTGEQVFMFLAGQSTPVSSPIILTAQLFGALTTYDWEYWNGTIWTNLTSHTQNTASYSLDYNDSEWGSNDTLRIRCISSGTFDEITIVKLYQSSDGIDAIVGYLTNEAVVVAANSSGGGYSYSGTGGIFKIYDGITDVTTSSIFNITGGIDQGTYWNITQNGLVFTVQETTGVYSLSGTWTSDSETVTLTADYGGVTVTKVYTISKSKAGVDADDPNYVVVTGQQAFIYPADGGAVVPTSIDLSASLFGLLTLYDWEYWNSGWSNLSGTQNAQTYNLTPANAAWGIVGEDALRIRCKSTYSTVDYFDEITVVKLREGTDAKVGYLTNENHTVASLYDGTGYSLTNTGGTFKVYSGIVDITTGAGTVFGGGTTKNGLLMTISSSTGAYSLSGASPSWTTDSEYFDLTATTSAAYGSVVITKRYTISKSKQGDEGAVGPEGPTGPSGVSGEAIIFRGLWVGGTTYTYIEGVRADVVKAPDTNYYVCNTTHTTSHEPPDVSYWNAFGAQFTSVATGLLLVDTASILSDMSVGNASTTGNLHSYTSSTILSNDTGYFFESGNASTKFRIGTVSGGALTKGFYWDGSNYLLKGGANNTIKSDTSVYWNNITIQNWVDDGILTNYASTNQDFETGASGDDTATGWTIVTDPIMSCIDLYNTGTAPFNGINTTYYHSGTQSFLMKVTKNATSYPLVKPNAEWTYWTLNTMSKTWAINTGVQSYVLSFWVRYGGHTDNFGYRVGVQIESQFRVFPVYYSASPSWIEIQVPFTTSAPSVTVTIFWTAVQSGSTLPFVDTGDVAGIYFDDFRVYQSTPFLELSEEGLYVFDTPSRYIKMGSNDFEIKGVDIDAGNVNVYGNLMVYGSVGILGDIGAIPPGYNPDDWDLAYTNMHTHSNKATLDNIQEALTTALKGNYDTAYNDKINSASFSTSTGVITLTQQDSGTVTVDIDGRYIYKNASSTSGYVPTWSGTGGDTLGAGYSVQTTLSSSTTALARADAIYTAVEAKIAKSIGTAKGQIIGFSASGAAGVLAVSTDGYGLVLDSAQTLGIKWQAFPTQYTNEEAQDAVAGMLIAGNVTSWTYVDATPSLKVDVGYNSTNLKITTNALNTIQDIATTSSPTFANLGIGMSPVYKLDVWGTIRAKDGLILGVNEEARGVIYLLDFAAGGNYFTFGGDIDVNFSGLFIRDNSDYAIARFSSIGADFPIGVTIGGSYLASTPPSMGLIVEGNVGIGTSLPDKALEINSANGNNLRLTYNDANGSASYYADFLVSSSGNLNINAVGDILFNPTGNDIYPAENDINLGTLTNRWSAIWASSLWVQTLVAQDVMATIGGRILITPTSKLTSDLAPAGTTMYVEHNSFTSGDFCILEAFDGTPKYEIIRINGTVGGSAGAYSYPILRAQSGGAAQWYKGDAVANTRAQGSGFIDLYSVHGVGNATDYGPTIVGNVRYSTGATDWCEHWAIGNLNGLYGVATNIYGVGFGKYRSGSNNILINDTTITFRDYATTLGSLSGTTWTLGKTGTGEYNVSITPTAVNFRIAETNYGILSTTAWTLGLTSGTNPNVYITSSAVQLRYGTTSRIALNSDGSGSLASGNIAWTTAGVLTASGWQLDATRIRNTSTGAGWTGVVVSLNTASSDATTTAAYGKGLTVAVDRGVDSHSLFVGEVPIYWDSGGYIFGVNASSTERFGILFTNYNNALPYFEVSARNVNSTDIKASIASWKFTYNRFYSASNDVAIATNYVSLTGGEKAVLGNYASGKWGIYATQHELLGVSGGKNNLRLTSDASLYWDDLSNPDYAFTSGSFTTSPAKVETIEYNSFNSTVESWTKITDANVTMALNTVPRFGGTGYSLKLSAAQVTDPVTGIMYKDITTGVTTDSAISITFLFATSEGHHNGSTTYFNTWLFEVREGSYGGTTIYSRSLPYTNGVLQKAEVDIVTSASHLFLVCTIFANDTTYDDASTYLSLDEVYTQRWYPFTELTSTGFISFFSRASYIQLGGNIFTLKGGNMSTQNIEVFGDLVVHGNTSIEASGYIPAGYNNTNWDTAYSSRIATFTTTGSSGSATFSTNTLNIPTYTLAGLGGEPTISAGTTGQYWRGDKTWQTLPAAGSGTVTSVVAGNGMTFTTFTVTGSVTMGTPSAITSSSTNSVSSGTHTHSITNGVFTNTVQAITGLKTFYGALYTGFEGLSVGDAGNSNGSIKFYNALDDGLGYLNTSNLSGDRVWTLPDETGTIALTSQLTSGTVTAVNKGNGMNFTDFSTSGTITLGTPSTCNNGTSNAISTSSHTHTIDGFVILATKNQAMSSSGATTGDYILGITNTGAVGSVSGVIYGLKINAMASQAQNGAATHSIYSEGGVANITGSSSSAGTFIGGAASNVSGATTTAIKATAGTATGVGIAYAGFFTGNVYINGTLTGASISTSLITDLSSWAGSSAITTLGTVTTGSWTAGKINVVQANTSTWGLGLRVQYSTNYWDILFGGSNQIIFGYNSTQQITFLSTGNEIRFGSNTADTNLYRSAANVLKTDDTFDCAGLNVGGVAVTGKSYTLPIVSTVFAPTDGVTTYYMGNSTLAPGTTATYYRMYIPKSGTIKSAYIFQKSQNANWEADSGTVGVYIRYNNTTDTAVRTGVYTSDGAYNTLFSNTALSIAVTAGSYIEIKYISADVWLQPPGNSYFSGYVYIE